MITGIEATNFIWKKFVEFEDKLAEIGVKGKIMNEFETIMEEKRNRVDRNWLTICFPGE
jgi:hypothetical protein